MMKKLQYFSRIASSALHRFVFSAALLFMSTGVAWSDNSIFTYVGTVNVNDVVYECYEGNFWGTFYYAYVKAIVSSESEVVIPSYVMKNDTKYYVDGVSYNPVTGDFSSGISNSSITKLVFTDDVYIKAGKYLQGNTFSCPNLREIVFKDGVSFMDDTYYYYFGDNHDITVYVSGKTESQIAELRQSHPIWSAFAAVYPYYNNFDYTLATVNNEQTKIVDLQDYGSYGDSGTENLPAVVTASGNNCLSGKLESGRNYATVSLYNNNRVPHLYRNGTEVQLKFLKRGNLNYAYYDELNLSESVVYTWASTDKECAVTIRQKQTDGTQKTGTVNYQHVLSGLARYGSFNAAQETITCGQGRELTLKVPFDTQKLNSVKMDGVTYNNFTSANSRYTIKLPVAAKTTMSVELIWNEPPTYSSAPPMVTVMRTGEGQVVFKGMNFLFSQHEGEEVWEERVVADCVDPVTMVTVPDEDYHGDPLADGCWSFRVEMTPPHGHVLKNFLLGHAESTIAGTDRPGMVWEDYTANSTYMTYDASAGTYVFDMDGDYMEFGSGSDYTLLVTMGPPESAIETGATLNFVRVGGGDNQSWIYWHDTDFDYYFNDGSSRVTIPFEELTDLQMYVTVKDGERVKIFKDGMNVTSQFQFNYNEYSKELDKESATYTVVYEKDDAVRTSFDWVVITQEGMSGGDVAMSYKENTVLQQLESGVNKITIAEKNLTQVRLTIPILEGMKVLILRNGEDVSSHFTIEDVYYIWDIPHMDLDDAVWSISYSASNELIAFADDAVKQICVDNWDVNGDGSLSYEEAAAVTDLGELFKGNAEITSFDELQYFTGLNTIPAYAFSDDSALKSIVLPKSVVKVQARAFYNCTSLENVVLPDSMEMLNTLAFQNCSKLPSITLPKKGRLTMGYGALGNAALATLYLPANLVKVYDYVLQNCNNLVGISVDEGNGIYDSREGCNGIIETASNKLVAACKNTVIPETVTALGDYAIYKISGLTKLVLPEGLTTVGSHSIQDCPNLTSVVSHIQEPPTITSTNINGLASNCVLTVPRGKRDAYIAAGWTTAIFKGGIVEEEKANVGDVNGDGSITIADVTKLVNIILGKE